MEEKNKEIVNRIEQTKKTIHRLIKYERTEKGPMSPKEKRVLKQAEFALINCNIFEINCNTLDSVMAKDMEYVDIVNGRGSEDKAFEYLDNFSPDTLDLPSPYTFVALTPRSPGDETMHTLSKMKGEQYREEVGFLITRDSVYDVNLVIAYGITTYALGILYVDGMWSPFATKRMEETFLSSFSMLNRVVTALSIINSFQTVVIGEKKQKGYQEENIGVYKAPTITPKAYYRVILRDKVVNLNEDLDNERIFKIIRERNYAYFVRAHPAHRIMRGLMPIEEKMEKYLRKDSRRRIFTSKDQVDSESWEILQKRGIRWEEGKWISLLPYRVGAYIANSKGGKNPYIPSIHVVPEK